MKPLSLEEIRQAVHGRWLKAGRPQTVVAVTTDSRTARAGELFVALRGPRFDGHAFLSVAAEAGCPAAMVQLDGEPRPEVAGLFEAGVIGVTDTVKALGALGGYHRGLNATTVIGVTGSNGKTTVKRMIHRILSRRLKGQCSPKSFNNAIGVPLTLLAAEPNDDYLVCELGSSGPGEIAALGRLTRPEVAVITSVAETHLEKLGSFQRIVSEKASILEFLNPDGLAVVWADNELLSRTVAGYPRRVVCFGQSAEAALRLTDYQPAGCGQRFEINNRLWVTLPVSGRHNAVNALAAIAVAQRFGFSQDDAAAALADYVPEPMRLEWIDDGAVTILNDAYNANPASVVAAADVLAETPARRRVMIVGDMCELGPSAEALHVQTGRQIAERDIDFLIGVGPLGRYIAQGAAEAGIETRTFVTLRQVSQAVTKCLSAGDVVCIKASRAMQMEKLIEPIRKCTKPSGPNTRDKGS